MLSQASFSPIRRSPRKHLSSCDLWESPGTSGLQGYFGRKSSGCQLSVWAGEAANCREQAGLVEWKVRDYVALRWLWSDSIKTSSCVSHSLAGCWSEEDLEKCQSHPVWPEPNQSHFQALTGMAPLFQVRWGVFRVEQETWGAAQPLPGRGTQCSTSWALVTAFPHLPGHVHGTPGTNHTTSHSFSRLLKRTDWGVRHVWIDLFFNFLIYFFSL